jgi:hypothetical protein
MINIAKTTGEGVSKTVSKFHLDCFKTARLGRDAGLELDDEYVEFSWNSIRLDLDQLKEWPVHHMISEPLEHRLEMISKCHKLSSFQPDRQIGL